jgi:hypothetical protein
LAGQYPLPHDKIKYKNYQWSAEAFAEGIKNVRVYMVRAKRPILDFQSSLSELVRSLM